MSHLFSISSSRLRSLILSTALLAPLSCPASATEGVLDIVAPFEIAGADPSVSGHIFQRMQIGETLLEVDDAGQPIPALAEIWEVSPDGLVWTFDLRDGVVFHDGTELTVEAVVGALESARNKTGVLERAAIEAIEADGDAVVIRLAEPFAPLSALLAHSSTMILSPASYGPDGQVTEIIGTGPFRLTSLEAPQRLTVERFADYWGEVSAIESATYLAASRGETRALMATSGDADFVFQLDAPSLARLQQSATVDVLTVPIARAVTLKANAGNEHLDSPEARRAVSLAINREGIAAAILRVPEAAANQLFPPSVAAWHNEELAPLTYAPEEASRLLAELGWEKGDDGTLTRDGKPFQLTLLTFSDRPELPLIATAMQDQLRQIGIALDVSVTSSSAIPAAHQDGSLELALFSRNFALVPDPFVTLLGDYPEGGSDWGSMNWESEAFHAAMDDLRVSTDLAAQERLRHEVTSILQDELPVIPIAWYQQTVAVSAALENVVIDPFERSFGISDMAWSAE